METFDVIEQFYTEGGCPSSVPRYRTSIRPIQVDRHMLSRVFRLDDANAIWHLCFKEVCESSVYFNAVFAPQWRVQAHPLHGLLEELSRNALSNLP
jgi:hypothetical protein